jgi:uncharacterized membrane protein YdfJ with MMPL/SSD domain
MGSRVPEVPGKIFRIAMGKFSTAIVIAVEKLIRINRILIFIFQPDFN